MRIFIHGLISLIRRPAKTAMLLIILFIVFNLIFIGLIIQNSISESKTYIRSQIGGVVEYKMDYSSFMNAQKASGTTTTTKTQPAENTRPAALSFTVAKKIAASKYVADYYVTESLNVSSTTIDPAETQSSSGGFQKSFSDFVLSGTNNTESINFVTNNVALSEGKALTEDNLKNGDKVILISQAVADANNLRVGDTVSLATVTRNQPSSGSNQQPGKTQQGSNSSNTTTGTSYDYEIIGIYKANNDTFDVNTIFTSNTAIYNLSGNASSDETSGSIVYVLNNAQDVDAFIKENTPYLTSEYHLLYSDDSEYTSLTKPLNLISFITSILIWVVFIAGAAIILAVVTIFVRDRKFEIGLLLSGGEGKIKIVSQFVFEMLVIAILAFGISVVSSNVASRYVSNWIVENQLLSTSSLIGSTSTTTDTTNQVNFRGPGSNNAISSSIYGSVDMESVAKQFNVAVSPTVILELLLASTLLVLIGSLIPLTAIMGFNPKRILQDY